MKNAAADSDRGEPLGYHAMLATDPKRALDTGILNLVIMLPRLGRCASTQACGKNPLA